MTSLPADFPDRLRDLFSTVDVARLLMRAERDDSRLERLLRLAVGIARAESGALLLVDEDRGDLLVAAAVGPGAQTLVRTHLPPGSGVAATALAGGEPIAVADPSQASMGDEIERRTGTAARNLLAVPFEVHGVAAGVLEVRNAAAERGFDPETISRVAELARIAAAAIEDWRGDRFLFSLFAAALPHAMAPGDDAARAGLAEEIRRWIDSIRLSAIHNGAVGLIEAIREVMAGGEESLGMCADVIGAIARRERARRERIGEH